jgi:ABC-type multidrug transport system permease subunit
MSICGNSLGFTIGSLFKEANQAAAMGPLITLPLMAFSGLYNKLSDIPSWISWLAYLSPFRYGLHMMLENQYEDLVVNLSDGSVYDYHADLEIKLNFF